MTDKLPRYRPDNLLTFDVMPEGANGEPNIFGGHAQQGQKREDALKRFANGDKTVVVYSNDDYNPVRVEDPELVYWSSRYKEPKS